MTAIIIQPEFENIYIVANGPQNGLVLQIIIITLIYARAIEISTLNMYIPKNKPQ